MKKNKPTEPEKLIIKLQDGVNEIHCEVERTVFTNAKASQKNYLLWSMYNELNPKE